MPKLNKPIDKEEFWKERIDNAAREHYSVYVTSEFDWKYIYTTHKAIIEEHIPQGVKVLDAGCGYGRMSMLFDNYTGVDFSPDFIREANKKYAGKKFIQANLKELPFGDGEFDWAFCVSIKRMVIDNLGEDEWNKMEKELKRVAKKVLILEYEDPKIYEIL